MKVCEFVVFRALGKNYQLISQKLHFPRLNSSLNKKNCRAKSERTHFLSVLTDRVHWPSAIVRVTPLYRMCERVAYLHVAFLLRIAKVCEKFVNSERIFLGMNPALGVDRAVFEIIYIYIFFFTVPIIKSKCLAKKCYVGGRMG